MVTRTEDCLLKNTLPPLDELLESENENVSFYQVI